jgi:hypothetical protein
MSEVLHANIFFIIASVATVVFSIFIGLILYQFYKIMLLIRGILVRFDSASEVVAEDVAHVRQLVASGGILSSLFGLAFATKKKRSRTKKSAEKEIDEI